MTPVARAVLGIVLVAGAGPAGFLIYHVVFKNHPLPTRPQTSAPAASEPASAPGSAPVYAPGSLPGNPDAPTLTTGTRSPPLTLPNLSLPDRDGRLHALAEYRGHPLVLNFWATWCEPCQREIPLLEGLQRQRGADLQVVGVAVDFQKDVLAYAQAHHITYPLLMGEKDGLAAVTAFGMDTAFPFTVFADARGEIVAVKLGELHSDEANLILGQVGAVDSGKATLADARDSVSTGLRSLAVARAQATGNGAIPVGGKS